MRVWFDEGGAVPAVSVLGWWGGGRVGGALWDRGDGVVGAGGGSCARVCGWRGGRSVGEGVADVVDDLRGCAFDDVEGVEEVLVSAVPGVGHVDVSCAGVGVEGAEHADVDGGVVAEFTVFCAFDACHVGEADEVGAVVAGHGEDEVPGAEFVGADLAGGVRVDGVSGVAQDAGCATVDGVALFFVGDSG